MVELGNKHECLNCNTKFYDLGKSQLVCPSCEADQAELAKEADKRPASKKTASRKKSAAKKKASKKKASKKAEEQGEAKSTDDKESADES